MFTNNGNDGILLSQAFGNMMADQTFRNIIGFKLLQDDNKANDGIGMAMIINNSSPFRGLQNMLPSLPKLPYQG